MEEASKYADIKKKTKVIYSGFDFSKLKNLNLKERNNKNKKKEFHFISVGRFHWKKAFHLSITAINKLLNMGINVKYTIIANDKPSEEILYQIRDLGISKNIFLKKISTQDQIYQEIYNSDCLILPSVEEGIANVVIESMAIGTQVISSDCGGMNEIIRDEYNGFLFKSRDSKDLVNKMEKIIFLDDIEKKLIIKKGKKTIKNKFSINKLGNEMEKIYSNVLKT
jgi:glycosyltransferase involved in cell wall biosynthesis